MKILIVEDESAAVKRLKKLLLEIDNSIEIIADLDSIESVLLWWTTNPKPDLLLLDIHLADGSSFEIFNHLNIDCPIIFTTAYDQYAIQAFKVNAVDYLLKPIKKSDLLPALEKVKRQSMQLPTELSNLIASFQQNQAPKRFVIKVGQHIRLVEMTDSAYFYTEDKITFLLTKEGKRYPIDYSLDKLDELLPTDKYFRINRQFIISIHAIQEMYAYSKSRVKIDLLPTVEHEVIVSTDRSPIFKKWLVGSIK